MEAKDVKAMLSGMKKELVLSAEPPKNSKDSNGNFIREQERDRTKTEKRVVSLDRALAIVEKAGREAYTPSYEHTERKIAEERDANIIQTKSTRQQKEARQITLPEKGNGNLPVGQIDLNRQQTLVWQIIEAAAYGTISPTVNKSAMKMMKMRKALKEERRIEMEEERERKGEKTPKRNPVLERFITGTMIVMITSKETYQIFKLAIAQAASISIPAQYAEFNAPSGVSYAFMVGDNYMLANDFHANNCKDITCIQAEDFIELLNEELGLDFGENTINSAKPFDLELEQ